MITKERWMKNVIDDVRRVFDRGFQEAAWFGNLPGVASSPHEVYCMLLEDSDFEDFIESEEIRLSETQRNLGYQLVHKMNKFQEKMSSNFTPTAILGSPDWDDIRSAANDF